MWVLFIQNESKGKVPIHFSREEQFYFAPVEATLHFLVMILASWPGISTTKIFLKMAQCNVVCG